jgi:hypothetical protein
MTLKKWLLGFNTIEGMEKASGILKLNFNPGWIEAGIVRDGKMTFNLPDEASIKAHLRPLNRDGIVVEPSGVKLGRADNFFFFLDNNAGIDWLYLISRNNTRTETDDIVFFFADRNVTVKGTSTSKSFFFAGSINTICYDMDLTVGWNLVWCRRIFDESNKNVHCRFKSDLSEVPEDLCWRGILQIPKSKEGEEIDRLYTSSNKV